MTEIGRKMMSDYFRNYRIRYEKAVFGDADIAGCGMLQITCGKSPLHSMRSVLAELCANILPLKTKSIVNVRNLGFIISDVFLNKHQTSIFVFIEHKKSQRLCTNEQPLTIEY